MSRLQLALHQMKPRNAHMDTCWQKWELAQRQTNLIAAGSAHLQIGIHNASQFGIDMGGISFTRNGVTAHITADGEVLNDKVGQPCDSCFEPFNKAHMIRIIDDRLMICQGCYIKHIQR